ncbi:hypothetical protein CDAR_472971 [Caerostris darwini]|uniref:Secreted protein n=1 Tax=Caerostris darwini TaxID=1538125 RepID=A0AAV4V8T7_9ARAC|nr:hypothetical protein CDAR_472971 [Caerostris darwini]
MSGPSRHLAQSPLRHLLLLFISRASRAPWRNILFGKSAIFFQKMKEWKWTKEKKNGVKMKMKETRLGWSLTFFSSHDALFFGAHKVLMRLHPQNMTKS